MKNKVKTIIMALAVSLIIFTAGCTNNKTEENSNKVSSEISVSSVSENESSSDEKSEIQENSEKQTSETKSDDEKSENAESSLQNSEVSVQTEISQEEMSSENSEDTGNNEESIVTEAEIEGYIEGLDDSIKDTEVYDKILKKNILIGNGEMLYNYRLTEDSYQHKIINYNGKIYDYVYMPETQSKEVKIITDDVIYDIYLESADPDISDMISKNNTSGEYSKVSKISHLGYLVYKEILGYQFESKDGDTETFFTPDHLFGIKTKTEDKKVSVTEINDDGSDGEVTVYEVRSVTDEEKNLIQTADSLME